MPSPCHYRPDAPPGIIPGVRRPMTRDGWFVVLVLLFLLAFTLDAWVLLR